MRLGVRSSIRGARRLGLGVTGALVALALASTGGCEDAYEPPCRVSSTRALVADPEIGVRPLVALARSRDRVTAWWARQEILVEDGGMGAAMTLAAFEVAVVEEVGALGLRASVPAPEELRARRAGVARVGLTVEGGAFCLLIETTATARRTGSSHGRRAPGTSSGVASRRPRRASCEGARTVASAALVAIDPPHCGSTPTSRGGGRARPCASARAGGRRRGRALARHEPPPRAAGLVGVSAASRTRGGGEPVGVRRGDRLRSPRAIARGSPTTRSASSRDDRAASAPDVRVSWDARGRRRPRGQSRSSSTGARQPSCRAVFWGSCPRGHTVAGRERTSRGRTALVDAAAGSASSSSRPRGPSSRRSTPPGESAAATWSSARRTPAGRTSTARPACPWTTRSSRGVAADSTS